MPAWNTRLRTLRPLKKLNCKLHILKNHLLASTCLPHSEFLNHFDDEQKRLLREEATNGRPSGETQMTERSPGLEPVVSRFVERPGISSWLGVIPTGPAQGAEVVPNADGGDGGRDRGYHYRLRRVQILDDEDDDNFQNPPFVTPIPSVRINPPPAPRKSEGTYARFHATFDHSAADASLDDSQSPLDAAVDRSFQYPKRYPKLNEIFSPRARDSPEVTASATDANLAFFSIDGDQRGITSTGSGYKYTDEVERGSTEMFLTAGIDHSFARVIDTSGTSIGYKALLHHRNDTVRHLPSIDSDIGSADIQSHPRLQDTEAFERVAKCPLSASSSTSEDIDDVQPISVSLSKLESALFAYPKRPSVSLNTSKRPQLVADDSEHTDKPTTPQIPLLEPSPALAIAEKVVTHSESIWVEDYSFINFSAPSRISLSTSLTVPPRRLRASPPSTQPRPLKGPDQLLDVSLRRRNRPTTAGKSSAPRAGGEGKKVRIVEVPKTRFTSKKAMPSYEVVRPAERLPSLLPAVSADFARDLNNALGALEKVPNVHGGSPALSSNAVENVSVIKNKLDNAEKVHFEAVLPPSALLSPVSKFSEGEATLYEAEAATIPARRLLRTFALKRKPQKPVIGVPLKRTKTRDHQRQHPFVYRKLLELYSLQYGTY